MLKLYTPANFSHMAWIVFCVHGAVVKRVECREVLPWMKRNIPGTVAEVERLGNTSTQARALRRFWRLQVCGDPLTKRRCAPANAPAAPASTLAVLGPLTRGSKSLGPMVPSEATCPASTAHLILLLIVWTPSSPVEIVRIVEEECGEQVFAEQCRAIERTTPPKVMARVEELSPRDAGVRRAITLWRELYTRERIEEAVDA